MSIITIILGILPGFAWLFFYLQEDEHPEPKKLIALTFVSGAASAFLALIAEKFINSALSGMGIVTLSLVSLIALAFAEEVIKFAVIYLTIRKNPAFDEPVDAMLYMVIGALGFATIENLGAVAGGQSSQLALLSTVFETAVFRFVGATLLHSLTSGIIGYFWATSIREFNAKKFVLYGLALATGLHAIFNYLIINHGSFVYPLIFVAVVGFFVLNDFEKLKRRSI